MPCFLEINTADVTTQCWLHQFSAIKLVVSSQFHFPTTCTCSTFLNVRLILKAGFLHLRTLNIFHISKKTSHPLLKIYIIAASATMTSYVYMFLSVHRLSSRNCVKEEFIQYVVTSTCLSALYFFTEWNTCVVSTYEHACTMYRKPSCIHVYCTS